MKKIVGLTLAVIAGGLMLFGMSGITNAQSFHTGDSVTIHENKPIESTIFAAGSTITIDSEVFGDVFCAGQTVTISGVVHGDVLCAGQTVMISGEVTGDVRLAGQTVTVNGMVGGNATIAGQTFVLDSMGTVAGDISVGSSDASLNGTAGRDILLGSETATVSGTVGRDITARVNRLTIADSAAVAGNVDYTSTAKLTLASDTSVAGAVTQHIPEDKAGFDTATWYGIQIAWVVYMLLAVAFSALLLVLLFPQLFKTVTDRAIPTPWRALLVGFVAHLAAPVAIFFLFLTVLGAPAALLAVGVWMILSAVSGIFSAFYVGRLLLGLRKPNHALLIMLVGVAVLGFAQIVPVLGFFVFLASLWTGTGMLLLSLAAHTPKPQYAISPAVAASKKK